MKYLQKITLLIMFLLMISTNLYASVETDVEDFMSNRIHTFDTQGHPKAKGVSLTMPYPQSWIAKEGERPNVVQKFQKIENNKIIATAIHILEVPENEKYTPDQVKSEEFRKKLIKTMGEHFKYIKSGHTKIEKQDAIWTVYIQSASNSSVEVNLYCLMYSFYLPSKHISIIYSVAGNSSDDTVSKLFDEYFKLFEVITAHVILPGQWNYKNLNPAR